jgi:type I restriction enzyme S subunit
MLARQIRGVSYKPEDLHEGLDDSSIPLLRANNIVDGRIIWDNVIYVDKKKVSSDQLLRKGDVLICASSGSKELVGKAATIETDGEFTFGAFCKVVRPCDAKNSDYLSLFFQSPYYKREIFSVAIGANINNIKNEHIDELAVKWPEIEKRNETVTLLKKVVTIINYKKQQLLALDDLIKARFVEMFGDMLNNSMRWPEQRLDSIADIISGITKGRKVKNNELYEVPYMAVSNVKDGYIDWTTVKTIMATTEEIEQYRLMPEDILMTEGGDPDKLGRGAIIHEPPKNCIHQNHIFRVRLNQDMVLPVFMVQYLQQQKAKQYFLRCAKQTTGIASINMKQLTALPVLLPTMKLQKAYVIFVAQVNKTKSAIQKSLEETQLLFDSLMQTYFG